MKKAIFLALLVLGILPAAVACEVCEAQQPKWLQGVVHGTGPQGLMDYVILFVGIAIVIAVLIFSVKFLVRPGEKNPDHVKYSILNTNEGSYGER